MTVYQRNDTKIRPHLILVTMSRGVRDLRELICVSRLTYRESDDDVITDDDCGDEKATIAAKMQKLSLGTATCAMSLDDSACVSDSGIVSNGHSTASSTDGASSGTPKDSDSSENADSRRKKSRKRKKKSVEQSAACSQKLVDTMSGEELRTSKRGDFDDILFYLDATIVSEWLVRANEWVNDLSIWCHTGTNFVDLAHFLLSDFPDIQRHKILELEYSIFMDEMGVAFGAGRTSGHVSYRDLAHLAIAVLREYPRQLLGGNSKGVILLLDYLDVLSSEKRESYRALLSDVKISTQNRQYAQLLLAVRAFALASLWFAVVNFYRKLRGGAGSTAHANTPSADDLKQLVISDQSRARFLQAIRYVTIT